MMGEYEKITEIIFNYFPKAMLVHGLALYICKRIKPERLQIALEDTDESKEQLKIFLTKYRLIEESSICEEYIVRVEKHDLKISISDKLFKSRYYVEKDRSNPKKFIIHQSSH